MSFPSLQRELPCIENLSKRVEKIYFQGDERLLDAPRVSIVGSRRPYGYTKAVVLRLASALAKRGVVVVSGAAMGVDALAHRGAGASNTIAVMPCGLDYRYPAINASLIDEIGKKGLLLSQFEPDFRARAWSFVLRNELVVALGEVLVVAQADRESGSMRSVGYAKAMGKPIYVFPHRLGESEGTNDLLAVKEAEAIFEIEAFSDRFGACIDKKDDLIDWCRKGLRYEEAVKRFGERLYEAELEGKITIKEGMVIPLCR